MNRPLPPRRKRPETSWSWMLLIAALLCAGVAALVWMGLADRPPTSGPEQAVAPELRTEEAQEEAREAVVPADTPPESPTPSGAYVRATVISRAGTPEPDALVHAIRFPAADPTAADAPDDAIETMTDEQGTARIPEVIPGAYLIEARKDTRAAQSKVLVEGEDDAVELTLVLAPAAAITGNVSGPGRKPITGARVAVDRKNYRPYGPRAARIETASAQDGAFVFENMPPGYYELVVESPGFAPAYSPPVQPGDSPVTIALNAGGMVRGEVRSASDGSAVAGMVLAAHAIRSGRAVEPVTTDGAGRFVMAGLAEDTYVIFGADDQWVLSGEPPRVPVYPGSAGEEVALVASPGVTVTGTVIDQATGTGLAGVHVAAIVSVEFVDYREGGTDSEGRYAMAGIPSGAFTFQFTRGRGVTRQIRAEIPAGANTFELDCEWPSGVTVEGSVVDLEGRPVPGAEVRAWEPEGTGVAWIDKGVSGARGEFALTNCRASEGIQLKAIAARGESAEFGPISLPGSGLKEIVLQLDGTPPAAVSGVVADSRGNPALARLLFRRSSGQGEGPQFRRNTASEADGFFHLAGLPPGDYTVEIGLYGRTGTGGGPPQYAGALSLRAGEFRSDLRYTVETGGIISGVVTDRSGAPLPGVRLSLSGRDGPGVSLNAESDAFGVYEMLSVPPGVYLLAASREGFGTATYRGASPGDVVDLVLPDEGTNAGEKPGVEWPEEITVYSPRP